MHKACLLLIFALVLSPVCLAGIRGSDSRLNIYSPGDVYVNETATLLIQLLDDTGAFESGAAGDIDITIRQNQSYVAIDANPAEISIIGQSYYEYSFVAEKAGSYIIYAEYGSLIDITMVVAKFALPKNISEQQYRVEGILGQERRERQELMSMTIGQMIPLDTAIQNLTRDTEESSILDVAQKEALSNAMQVVFYSIVFMGLFLASSIIYTRPKDQYKLFERMQEIPQQVAKGVTEEVQTGRGPPSFRMEKRKAYERQGHTKTGL